MVKNGPKISVVLPTYQRAAQLQPTLETLVRQTAEDYEVIVADDGSEDGTWKVLGGFRNRIRCIRSEHIGLPGIINRALIEARGEYVMLCNDHDFYAPETLEALASGLDDCPSASLAVSDVVLVDPGGIHELAIFAFPYQGPVAGVRFMEEQLLPGLGAVAPHNMWRADRLRGEYLDEAYGVASDAELWLRLATRGDVVHVPKRLVRARERDITSSLYLNNHAVISGTLRAKRAYLHYIHDSSVRAEIEKDWRTLVDRSCVVAMWRLLENQRREGVPAVSALGRQEGSRLGRTLVPALAGMPPSLTLALLSFIRIVTRLRRGQ